MGDRAREISKAGEEVFGNVGVRLMCWPHTYRNLVPRMSALKNANKKLQEQLTSDIENPRTCSGLCILRRHSALICLSQSMCRVPMLILS